MNPNILTIHLLLVVFLTFFENSGAVEDENWIDGLYFSTDRGDLANARRKCAERNMSLVVVDEKYKNDAIGKKLKDNAITHQYFIGADRRTKDGVNHYNVEYRWYNMERLSFRNFAEGRPDNTLEFEKQPRTHLSLRYDKKVFVWFDSHIKSQFWYICETPREPDVKGPPDPENRFKINITYGRTQGILNSIDQCQSDYKQCVLGLDNEEIKDSFLDILRRNDDRQHYYINAWREDAKSPYVWYGVNITADNKYWGSGKPSEKDDEQCAKVWYDPTSDGLNWASASCNEKHYKACQGEENVCGKRYTCFDDKNFLKSLYFSEEQGDAEYAKKKCADMKMRLVVLDEQYKQDALKCILATKHFKHQYYIGADRMTKDGRTFYNVEFRWYNMERLSFRHFAEGRPDNTLDFEKQPKTHISLRYVEKDLLWWDTYKKFRFRYICEIPRDPDVKGPPEPENRFKINITTGRTPGIWKMIDQCQSVYKQCLIGLDNEEIKESFLDILRSNDDRQQYYINAWREDAKSPYVWYGVNVTADNKYWGSGKPSEKDDENCAKVWYDPTSDGLNWTSAACNEKHYKACQGDEDTCGKRDTCFDDQNFLKSLYFSKDEGNVEFAEKKCADMKMRLVIVDEQYKHDALKCILAAKRDMSQYHMGGRRITKDGEKSENAEFRWLNDERLSFRHFGKDRPDNTRQINVQPYTQLSIKYNEKDLLWWDIDTISKYKYICEPPRENYVKGPPDPKNPFEIYFGHNKMNGFEKNSEECKTKYNKNIISLETEEIKKSFMDMLIQNDDRKFYYINVMRNDSKSPYMWYNTTIKADDKFWGSGQTSEAGNHKCARVAYDPILGDLKWASTSCYRTFYIACQGDIQDEPEASSEKTPNCTSDGTGISGDAAACGGIEASGSAEVSADSEVSSSTEVSSGAEVSGDAGVSGNAGVSGDAEANGGASGNAGEIKLDEPEASSDKTPNCTSGGTGASGVAAACSEIGASGNAEVSGGAEVNGGAEIGDGADVSGGAEVDGGPEFSGGAEVSSDAGVFGNAGVSGDAEANGEAEVSGNDDGADVSGGAEVSGGPEFSGGAEVSGDAGVFGNAGVSGDAEANGGATVNAGGSASAGSIGKPRRSCNTFKKPIGK